MNNEANIILGIIAGSEAFEYRAVTGKKYQITISKLHHIIKVGSIEYCTILAKRVEDMSKEEKKAYDNLHWLTKDRYDVINKYDSFHSKCYAISEGYLPKDLANILIENGINVEWVK